MADLKQTKPKSFNFVCPIPLRRYPNIVMGHGSGGEMMNQLIEHLFIPSFGQKSHQPELFDGALLDAKLIKNAQGKLVFSADSFVISPAIFPGGNIGSLAVHGTVNDLAMMGAVPQYLSVSFILEEGLPMETLAEVVHSLGQAAHQIGVQIVTGDTKVVDRGHGDGIYINTNGIGIIPKKVNINPRKISPGDVMIINGTLGDHGMAIMSIRAGLEFDTPILSDSAAINDLVQSMLEVYPQIHAMRDLTRGGLAAATNELSQLANVGMVVQETDIPISKAVHGACEMLGLDPIYVANEGKMLAIVPKNEAEKILKVMRKHPLGKDSQIIGQVIKDHPGIVTGITAIGGERVIDLPAGELLPRIC